MVLSFKEQFKEPIIEGNKIHSIREDKTNRWKAGNKIHFATGVRTKNYNCFKEGVCIRTQKIEFSHKHRMPYVSIDNKILSSYEAEDLAKKDGFDTLEDFFKWFGKDFKGKIIHWTGFIY